MSSFVTFYHPTDFLEPLDDSYNGLLFQTKDGELAMVLSRVDLPNGEVGCVFLKNNMCSIQSFKPLVCRQYPFQPQDPNNSLGPFRLMDNPCFGKHAEDEIVDENPVRINYRDFHQKQDEYLQKVKEWNDDPASREKGIEDFLSFVGLRWD